MGLQSWCLRCATIYTKSWSNPSSRTAQRYGGAKKPYQLGWKTPTYQGWIPEVALDGGIIGMAADWWTQYECNHFGSANQINQECWKHGYVLRHVRKVKRIFSSGGKLRPCTELKPRQSPFRKHLNTVELVDDSRRRFCEIEGESTEYLLSECK